MGLIFVLYENKRNPLGLKKNTMKLRDANLKPMGLWKHFDMLCAIPHPSGHEQAIGNYILEVCSKAGVEARKDEWGNIFIKKEATNGKPGSKTILLQSHMDMVPQANENKNHDFAKDPIVPIVDNGWVRADDTTLGSDNGIGLAATLAIMEDNTIQHGPLTALITVEEESRMLGASKVSPDFFEGDIMINLDAEDITEIYISCAGGCSTTATLKLQYEPISNTPLEFYTLYIKGLEGGHSGVDIILNRGNAIKIMGEVLTELNDNFKLSVSALNGGSLWNAIPREASAKFAMAKDIDAISEISKINDKIKAAYKETDPDLNIEVTISEPFSQVLESGSCRIALSAMNIHPNGALKMSHDVEGVVETSSNLGILKTKGDLLTLCSMQRSLIDSERDTARDEIIVLLESLELEISLGDSFPGWVPHPHSEIVEKCKKVFKELFNKEEKIMAIHAGLECGFLGKKKPDMEMIAIGPTIKFPHSPKEKVEIASVEKFWQFLVELVK